LTAIQESAPKWVIATAIAEHFGDKVDFRLAFISDTIAISVCPKPGVAVTEQDKGYLVTLAAGACGYAIKSFLGIPLALRGCITFGEHQVDGNFLIGQAVDQAASLYEDAQAAMVWMTPLAANLYRHSNAMYKQSLVDQALSKEPAGRIESAGRVLRFASAFTSTTKYVDAWERGTDQEKDQAAKLVLRLIAENPYDLFVHNYPVPLKSRSGLQVSVLNPFHTFQDSEIPSVFAAYFRSFQGESTLDVILKQQATEAFLKTAIESRQRDLKKYLETVERLGKEIWPSKA
jgi:hypothetical protein